MECKHRTCKNVILTRVSPRVVESLLFTNTNLIRGGPWTVTIEVVKMLFLLVYPQVLSKACLFKNIDPIRGASWVVKIKVVKMSFLLVYPQGSPKAYYLEM